MSSLYWDNARQAQLVVFSALLDFSPADGQVALTLSLSFRSQPGKRQCTVLSFPNQIDLNP